MKKGQIEFRKSERKKEMIAQHVTLSNRALALKRLLFVCMVLCALPSRSQVGINNANPDNSAILDLNDTKRGFLVPRMSSQERMGIRHSTGAPAEGLLVYDTDDKMFYYYNPNNSDGDNDMGDQNWQAIPPLQYQDVRDNTATNGDGETVFLRTLETHQSVKDISLFADTPGSYDQSTAPRLRVMGQVSVGADERPPSQDGLHVEGASDFASDIRVNGEVGQYTDYGSTSLAYQTTFVGAGTTPIGGIITWSGSHSALPPGWRLCNGSGTFTNELGQQFSIPDLRNMFILGAGDKYESGDVGGEENVTLQVSELPSHTHEVIDNEHSHSYNQKLHESTRSDATNDRTVTSHNQYNTSDETTTSSKTGIVINPSNGGAAHNNMPPYYALAYIIRVD